MVGRISNASRHSMSGTAKRSRGSVDEVVHMRDFALEKKVVEDEDEITVTYGPPDAVRR